MSQNKFFEHHDDNHEIDITSREHRSGLITELDKLIAGKQILAGIGILYIFTLVAYLIFPDKGSELVEIAKMVFPPLATLIIAFYFRDNKSN